MDALRGCGESHASRGTLRGRWRSQRPEGRFSLAFLKLRTELDGTWGEGFRIKAIFELTRSQGECLGSAGDRRDRLETAGVCHVPCSCGGVYVGIAEGWMSIGLVEHGRNCRMGTVGGSAMVETALAEDRRVLLSSARVLSDDMRCFPRNFGGTIGIRECRD